MVSTHSGKCWYCIPSHYEHCMLLLLVHTVRVMEICAAEPLWHWFMCTNDSVLFVSVVCSHIFVLVYRFESQKLLLIVLESFENADSTT